MSTQRTVSLKAGQRSWTFTPESLDFTANWSRQMAEAKARLRRCRKARALRRERKELARRGVTAPVAPPASGVGPVLVPLESVFRTLTPEMSHDEYESVVALRLSQIVEAP